LAVPDGTTEKALRKEDNFGKIVENRVERVENRGHP